MKIIQAGFEIETEIDGEKILKSIEKAGRTAYKSEDKITGDSCEKFVRMIISRGHESVLEHRSITVRIVCDRGVTHEIVRHRLASYTQESTRYCNYSKDKFQHEITVIEPVFWNQQDNPEKYETWLKAMKFAEQSYLELIEEGATPQEARAVLPNSLKTEIVMTMNLRQWRTFFKVRADSHAHPQMQEIAAPLLEEFKRRIPVIFDDLSY